jgi:hypothetical protein
MKPYFENIQTKKSWWSGSSGREPACKYEALSSHRSTAKKKKKKKNRSQNSRLPSDLLSLII